MVQTFLAKLQREYVLERVGMLGSGHAWRQDWIASRLHDHKHMALPFVHSCIISEAPLVAGVDIGAVLEKIGIQVNNTSEKVGTVAIAYAAHKALSPVRFPPTVALTPVVARLLGRKGADSTTGSAQPPDANSN
jgi:Protein of unknown function (DUF1279)